MTGQFWIRLAVPLRLIRRTGISAFSASLIAAMAVASAPSFADPPDLKTPAPVIYLADNLSEQDNLGYCIDTVGRGFGDRLHAHSCKPRGGDVQFIHDSESQRIESAAFPGHCAELLDTAAPGVTLGLVTCDAASARQAFVYDSGSMEIRPGDDSSLCLAAGEEGRSAGPFMSRDLLLVTCDAAEAKLRQWIIREAPS